MKMLVTGGAGFIGSNFVHHIVKKYPDYDVIVVDALTYAGSLTRLDAVKDRISFHKTDITDEQAMDALIKGADYLVHFAAESHVDRSIAQPGPFLQTNILGTEVLSRLAVKHGIKRFHHVSTDEVFGTLELDSHERFNEDTPYDPRSPYSASKASSDHIVRAYGETYGLPFTITNCSNNYGPWDSPGRAVPVFITRILSGETIPLYGKGDFVRDYLYVQDHVNAIDSAIHQGRIMQTYTVGGGAEKTGVELATAILEAMGESTDRIEFVEDRPGHDSRYAINPAKITRELGWKQSVTFEEGIQNTVAWYKTNEEWWRPYKDKLSLLRDSANYKQAKGKRVGRDR